MCKLRLMIIEIIACSIPHATWKTFIKRRADIERLRQSTSSSPIQDLNVKLVKIRDMNNIKLILNVCT